MDYLEWNDAIASYFFREDMANRRVFLAVTVDVIQEIGQTHSVGMADFLKSLRIGPPWTRDEADVCCKALLAKSKWRERNLPYPPYIAYLAVFVLAADHSDEYAANAYYEPLEILLSAPVNRKFFADTYMLWLDLQKWSREDKAGELGICRYSLPRASHYVNVGLPRSQTLFLSAERNALPHFFSDNHLDPTSLPSETSLLRALRPATFLRASTRSLLEKSDVSSRELQSALAGFVLDELQSWDGSVEQQSNGSLKSARSTQTAAGLRLCLKIITLAGRADVTARFKANRPFPDDTLNLSDTTSMQVWLGRESQDGWSWPLFQVQGTQKRILDATTLEWTRGQRLRDTELNWRVALPPALVRLFLPGRREGLNDDWVEASHLVPGSPFCVAYRSSEQEIVEAWGREHCEAFQPLPLSGLPNGWMLFRAKNALRSLADFDLLTLSSRRRLMLVGGIKAEGKHTFFHFDRPCITLDGGDGTEKITCSHSTLVMDADGLWIFPDSVPIDMPLRVECGEEFLTLTLRSAELCLKYDAPSLDVWGTLTDGAGTVSGVQAPEEELLAPPRDVPTHFGGHIVFLGRRAGEIADWPADPLPREWAPVWAIVKLHRNEWQAHFIGTANDFSDVRQTKQGAWRKWREIYTRRTTNAVGIKRIREFWTQCKREAERL
jgi:hypothetical protein